MTISYDRFITACLLITLTVGASAQAAAQREHIDYWSVWADARGMTHQTQCRLTNLSLETFAPPAAPEWVSHGDPQAKRLVFNVAPVGWVGSWHRNPALQWVIPLEGHWFVETSDGRRRTFGPGEMMLGGDQGAHEINGHEGHLSGIVGNTPVRIMVIQLDHTTFTPSKGPCLAGGEPIDGPRQ